MKYLIAILIVFFSLSGQGQTKYQSFIIKGHFKNLSNKTVTLAYAKNSIDSIKTDAEGNFMLKGKVAEPSLAWLNLGDRQQSFQFFLENTMYTINGDQKDMAKITVKGGREQSAYNKYSLIISELGRFTKDMQMPLHFKMAKNDTSGLSSFVYATTLLWRDSLAKRQVDFIAKNPSSAVSLNAMHHLIATPTPVSSIDSLMRLIEATPIGRYATALKLRKTIDARLKLTKGAQAPDFNQPDTAGKVVLLSGLRGKYVLLDFWASWCAPCRGENPNVLKVYQKHKGDNFTVLAVSIDVKRDDWIKAVKEDELPWTQVSDLKAKNAASGVYGITAIPMNFLIDPKGTIIGVNLRGEELANAVEAAVKSKSR